jgi:hypothetical protein
MAQSKTTQDLPQAEAAGKDDQLLLNVAGANNTYTLSNLTVEGLFTNVPTGTITSVDNLIIRQESQYSVPVSSDATATKGMMWYDDDYLYIATADDHVKRVALSDF